MPLLIKCSSPFAAPRHPHLRAPPHVCCHVCCAHARPCLSTGWALNGCFDRTLGTAAVLARGGGGGNRCSCPDLLCSLPLSRVPLGRRHTSLWWFLLRQNEKYLPKLSPLP